MSRPRVLAIVFLTLTVVSGVALVGQQERPASDRDRLIGAWRLVSLEAPGPDGAMHTSDATGLFMFTREGRLGVQVMQRSRGRASPCGAAAVRAGRVRGHVRPVRGRRGRAHLHLLRRGQPGPRAGGQGVAARLHVHRQPTHHHVHESGRALARDVGALLRTRSASGLSPVACGLSTDGYRSEPHHEDTHARKEWPLGLGAGTRLHGHELVLPSTP